MWTRKLRSFPGDPIDEVHECNGPEGNEAKAFAWNEGNLTILRNCTTDDCNGVTVTSDYDFANLTDECALTGSITVIYTIEDECGNKTTKEATFSIEDNTPPVVGCDPQDKTIECISPVDNKATADTWNAQNISDLNTCVFDNCGTTFRVESDYDFNRLTVFCGASGSIEVTYTVYDECDNFITKKATFTIEDKVVNIAGCPIEPLVINCSDNIDAEISNWLTGVKANIKSATESRRPL